MFYEISYKLLVILSPISLPLFQKDRQTNLSSKVYLSLLLCTPSGFNILKLITVTILDEGYRAENSSKSGIWSGDCTWAMYYV